MLALRQVTDWDQAGAVVWEETAGQEGSPERLMDTTSQSRATAALHILLPRKPFPPQTTSFFLAAVVAMEPLSFMCKCLSSSPMPDFLSLHPASLYRYSSNRQQMLEYVVKKTLVFGMCNVSHLGRSVVILELS